MYVFLCGVGVGALLVWLMRPLPDPITSTGMAASAPIVAGNLRVAGTASPGIDAGVTKAERPAVPPATLPRPPAVAVKSVPESAPVTERSNRPSAAPARSQAPVAIRPPQFRGALVVGSRPAGAQVALNGQAVGATPLVLTNLDVGSRAVRITLDGYRPWTSAIRIVANQKATLTATLQPAPSDAAQAP